MMYNTLHAPSTVSRHLGAERQKPKLQWIINQNIYLKFSDSYSFGKFCYASDLKNREPCTLLSVSLLHICEAKNITDLTSQPDVRYSIFRQHKVNSQLNCQI
jgi:hypothetical protein